VASAHTTLRRHTLCPLSFNSASKQDLVEIISERAAANAGGFCIGYVNPHVYNLAQEHGDVNRFINQCDLVCIDGLGTALALKAAQRNSAKAPIHRVVALNLFDELITQAAVRADALLIGVNADEVQLSADNINQLESRFRIIATKDGFRSESEYSTFLGRHASVRWVLIGAGTPKSESIALLARAACPQAIIFHIGAGTIKVYAGCKRRAPAWVSRYGLEWAHRMLFEPHTRNRYTRGGWQFVKSLLPALLRRPSRRSAR
jgi:N-acetylglucosaminyldiphosphoundecaprenol N-acetyl-beta-D-mannosaminyltransferase